MKKSEICIGKCKVCIEKSYKCVEIIERIDLNVRCKVKEPNYDEYKYESKCCRSHEVCSFRIYLWYSFCLFEDYVVVFY